MSPASTPVHPRACGEHISWKNIIVPETGSSPRLRGTSGQSVHRRSFRRFIPAPAGNISLSMAFTMPAPVHPRACGEHDRIRELLAEGVGSSPRLRGTSCAGHALFGPHRFIPAPAGNIGQTERETDDFPVHPRACGEHLWSLGASVSAAGSSPRLRGTFCYEKNIRNVRRFIPAPAGNISCRGCRPRRNTVHPRACGEHKIEEESASTESGSSPRLRGTLSERVAPMVVFRFIPAPAGNITSQMEIYMAAPVHPRACGEHSS